MCGLIRCCCWFSVVFVSFFVCFWVFSSVNACKILSIFRSVLPSLSSPFCVRCHVVRGMIYLICFSVKRFPIPFFSFMFLLFSLFLSYFFLLLLFFFFLFFFLSFFLLLLLPLLLLLLLVTGMSDDRNVKQSNSAEEGEDEDYEKEEETKMKQRTLVPITNRLNTRRTPGVPQCNLRPAGCRQDLGLKDLKLLTPSSLFTPIKAPQCG